MSGLPQHILDDQKRLADMYMDVSAEGEESRINLDAKVHELIFQRQTDEEDFPSYSYDMNSAMMVYDKLQEDTGSLWLQLRNMHAGVWGWYVDLSYLKNPYMSGAEEPIRVKASSWAHGICVAAVLIPEEVLKVHRAHGTKWEPIK